MPEKHDIVISLCYSIFMPWHNTGKISERRTEEPDPTGRRAARSGRKERSPH